jgi:hypothetical protein
MFLNALFKKDNLVWYFAVLAVLSVYYGAERILNVDSSFSFFQLVNFNQFWYPENRIGVFLTQIPLLLGAKLNLPLSILLPLFSVTFIVLYFVVFLVCKKYLNNFTAAFTIIMVLLSGVQASFYHPVTETHQALVYSALLFAWIRLPDKNLLYHNLVALLIVGLCLLTHPISIFSVLFVL